MLIDCVTPNVALDRTLVVPGYQKGGVFRPQQAIVVAGGKGLNVARAARTLGASVRCYGFIAGYTGRLLLDLAQQDGLDCYFTPLGSGETRTCTTLIDPETTTTSVINEAGPLVTLEDWAHLRADLLHRANPGTISVCGSLPPGPPVSVFADFLRELVAAGHHVWIDSSGPALAAAAQVPGVHLKVNNDEAAQLTGKAIRSPEDASKAAFELQSITGKTAIITLGKDGAVLVSGDACWHAVPPSIAVKNVVASGDSFLAGLLVSLASGTSADRALCAGVAAGAANAQSDGGGHFTRADFLALERNTRVAVLA